LLPVPPKRYKVVRRAIIISALIIGKDAHEEPVVTGAGPSTVKSGFSLLVLSNDEMALIAVENFRRVLMSA
jgi:hypothetical protein